MKLFTRLSTREGGQNIVAHIGVFINAIRHFSNITVFIIYPSLCPDFNVNYIFFYDDLNSFIIMRIKNINVYIIGTV